MKRVLALILMLCLAACFAQTALATVTPNGDETSNHTIVRIWITDGKDLPDTNQNNPVLFVRVVDENGTLLPNATVTLHLLKPLLATEVILKSEGGSTLPTQGEPAAAVTYKVFSPKHPALQYVVRANALGYREGVTPPFQINFEVSGTITVTLKKRNPATDLSVTYVLRDNDKAELSFTHAEVTKGTAIGSENVPQVVVPSTATEQWKLIGYFINGTKYTAEELAAKVLQEDTRVEIRTMPDQNDNQVDDREEGKKPGGGGSGYDAGGESVVTMIDPPKTGAEDGYGNYILGLCGSLLVLVLLLLTLVYRAYQEKKCRNET